jgi:hypothetical protein
MRRPLDFFNERAAEILFNGRSVPDTKVTIQELIARKDSIVRVNGKLYSVKVTEVEVAK